MSDYFFYKILNFNIEFGIYPTHYIMNVEEYKQAQLLKEYVPSYQSIDLKECLFGISIIIADVEECKCAVLY